MEELTTSAASHTRKEGATAIFAETSAGSMVAVGPARRFARRRGGTGWSRRARWFMLSCLLLGFAFYVVFGILPAAATVLVSLTNYSGLPGAGTRFQGLQEFVAAFTSERPVFVASIRTTLIFVSVVTAAHTGGGLALAHRLATNRRGDAFLRALVFLPTVLGATVIGIVWLLVFDPVAGPVADLLSHVGFHSSFFGSSSLALPLVIFVQAWAGIGFSTLVYIGGLRAIPHELLEAAEVDGTGWWLRFLRITWPLLAPSTTVVVLLSLVGSFTTYNIIYVLTEGQAGTNTLGMLSFTAAFGGSADLGFGAAMSVVLFLMTLAVCLPVVWWLRRREERIIG